MPDNNENTILHTDIDPDDAMLPDGWAEGDDFFSPDTWTGGAADGQQDAEGSNGENADDQPGEAGEQQDAEGGDTPTTDDDDNADGGNAGNEMGDDADGANGQETDSQSQQQRKIKFRARVNHEDQDVELDPDQLPAIWQKAQDYDRRALRAEQDRANGERLGKLDRAAKALGYDSADEMLEEAVSHRRTEREEALVASGIDETTAKDIAALLEQRGGANNEGQQAEAQQQDDANSGGTGRTKDTAARNFDAELSELLREAPEMRSKTLPDEVVQDAVENGKSLLSAYRRWETKQIKSETERLKKENAVLKQNAAAAARAPVRGVRGGAAAQPAQSEFERNFLKGFDDDRW